MLPIFHPTTTILVDDVPSYLESFKDAAPPDLPIQTFESPENAIAHIKRQNDLARQNFNRYLRMSSDMNWEVIDNNMIEEQVTRVSLSGLKNKAMDADRFNEVSVIICDYAMPSMKGTDFFAKLGNVPQKRILLTGEADATVAVQAFNDGLIDQFITKGKTGAAVGTLFNHIRRYQRDYFLHQYSFLTNLYKQGESLFAKPAFEKLIHRLYASEGFVEHYYANFPTGTVMLDECQKRKRLVVQTDDDYAGYLDSAEDFADPDLIAALNARSVVLNESYGGGIPTGLKYWREMCEPAQVFDADGERLYYALFELRDELQQERIKMFADFADGNM